MYHIVASRRTCYYSENQNFFFKVSNTNMPNFFFRNKTFFCLLNELKFCEEKWNLKSWILIKFQLIRTTFIFWCPMLRASARDYTVIYLWSELHSFTIKHLCFWVSPSGLSVCNSGIKDTLIVLWIELGGFSKFPGSLQIPFRIHQEESVMQMHRRIVWGHAICLGEPRFSLRVPRFL